MTLQGQSAKEEIKRQLDILWGERWRRMSLAMLAFMLASFFLPWWVTLLCGLTNFGSELAAMYYMRALDPKRHPKRYRLVMALMFLMQSAYALPPVLIWQLGTHYAEAFAVGMIMTTPLHMISARAIHLPFGICGYMGTSVLVLVANSFYWSRAGEYGILLFSTVSIIGVLAYSLISMLSNHRLHAAAAADRKLALDSSKAQSRFLAQMSHELRTPLNAILGMGHAELRRNKDALSQNRLSVLIASAQGLSTILDDILDMSAVDAGRLPIRPQSVTPRREILETIALFQPGIAAAGLEINHHIAPQLSQQMLLDPQRLRQCLSNLLSNALKNTPEGRIDVTARLTTSAQGQTLLCVEVADTGPGIPANMQREIFEPFSQARNLKSGMEGNGLGLSICRSMARQMGGDLTLAQNSTDQSGAHFILTIATRPAPKAPPLEATKQGISAPRPDTTIPPAPRGLPPGLSVLVVDDIATNRLVASTYLRMLGASMTEAQSGEEALEILSKTTPDLVLLDLNMPVMSGLEVLARIRALPGAVAKVPVIAMTADAMEKHRSYYLASGVDGYVSKPIGLIRIEAEINAVLKKQAARP